MAIGKFVGPPSKIKSANDLFADSDLSLFQKVLLSTDGTVTELLSLYCGKPIRARKVAQSLATGGAPAWLAAAPKERILHRTILLGSGEAGDDELLFADSWFVFDRFSAAIQHDLLHTELPIGLLWRRERLEMHREIVDRRSETCAAVALLLGAAENTALYSRTYLIVHRERPLGVIIEKFRTTEFY